MVIANSFGVENYENLFCICDIKLLAVVYKNRRLIGVIIKLERARRRSNLCRAN